MFCRSFLTFCPFSFDHHIVCFSLSYGIWLPFLVSSSIFWRSLRMLYGRNQYLFNRYGIYESQMTTDMICCRYNHILLFMICHWIFYQSQTSTVPHNWFCGWFFVSERHFQQYFNYIMATSFSGGRSRRTRREPLTMGKQLVNFITCSCESSVPFFIIYTPFWW